MSRNTIRRSTLALVLSLTLASSPALAASSGSWRLAAEFGRSAWSWLASLLEGGALGPKPTEVRKAGCTINPDGQPVCEPTAESSAKSDRSCDIDPNGYTLCNP
jgi:hypothetical protein